MDEPQKSKPYGRIIPLLPFFEGVSPAQIIRQVKVLSPGRGQALRFYSSALKRTLHASPYQRILSCRYIIYSRACGVALRSFTRAWGVLEENSQMQEADR